MQIAGASVLVVPLLLILAFDAVNSARLTTVDRGDDDHQPEGTPRNRRLHSEKQIIDKQWACATTGVFKCPDASSPSQGGIYADPENCTCFYQCFGRTPYHKKCADGLQFFEELAVCDLPLDSECRESKK